MRYRRCGFDALIALAVVSCLSTQTSRSGRAVRVARERRDIPRDRRRHDAAAGRRGADGLVPAPVQTATAADIDAERPLDLSNFLNRRMNGVHVNEVQNNPFQPDVNYRGYTASPLLGTPQGLSVYMDGVRLNQPFGEVVSWDLIPRIAHRVDDADARLESAVRPEHARRRAVAADQGRPLAPGHDACRRSYGSDVAAGARVRARRPARRRAVPLVSRRQRCSPRTAGATTRRPTCGRSSARSAGSASAATLTRLARPCQQLADRQRPAGLPAARARLRQHLHQARHDRQPLDAAQRHRRGASSSDRAVAARPTPTTATSAPTRSTATSTRSRSISRSISRAPPSAPRSPPPATATIPASGLDASNTPFPSLRCIGNVLLNDEPSEKCNGLINRDATRRSTTAASPAS